MGSLFNVDTSGNGRCSGTLTATGGFVGLAKHVDAQLITTTTAGLAIPSGTVRIDCLLLGAGGGAGSRNSQTCYPGGGSAGMLIRLTSIAKATDTTLDVTIGTGGAAHSSGNGDAGGNSVITFNQTGRSWTAYGGGGSSDGGSVVGGGSGGSGGMGGAGSSTAAQSAGAGGASTAQKLFTAQAGATGAVGGQSGSGGGNGNSIQNSTSYCEVGGSGGSGSTNGGTLGGQGAVSGSGVPGGVANTGQLPGAGGSSAWGVGGASVSSGNGNPGGFGAGGSGSVASGTGGNGGDGRCFLIFYKV